MINCHEMFLHYLQIEGKQPLVCGQLWHYIKSIQFLIIDCDSESDMKKQYFHAPPIYCNYLPIIGYQIAQPNDKQKHSKQTNLFVWDLQYRKVLLCKHCKIHILKVINNALQAQSRVARLPFLLHSYKKQRSGYVRLLQAMVSQLVYYGLWGTNK